MHSPQRNGYHRAIEEELVLSPPQVCINSRTAAGNEMGMFYVGYVIRIKR
jgi:hypothetical protein